MLSIQSSYSSDGSDVASSSVDMLEDTLLECPLASLIGVTARRPLRFMSDVPLSAGMILELQKNTLGTPCETVTSLIQMNYVTFCISNLRSIQN